jgi:hypothetical protein
VPYPAARMTERPIEMPSGIYPGLVSGAIAPVGGAHAIAAYGSLGVPGCPFALLADLREDNVAGRADLNRTWCGRRKPYCGTWVTNWVTIGPDTAGWARTSMDHARSPEPTRQQVSVP